MRTAWRVAGALATVVALLLSTMGLWRTFADARTPTDVAERSIPFDGKSLRIEVAAGDQVSLDIIPGRAGALLVQRVLRWSRGRPDVTDLWDAKTGTLRLGAVCPGSDQPGGPVCRADYLVFIPPETDLEADTTGGNLSVSDLFGKLRLSSVSGDIEADDITGAFWARSGTGSVAAYRLDVERADVEVGAGDVKLSFTSVPTDVKAVVRTAGDVVLEVPPAAYDATVEAAETDVNIEQRPEAKRKILARAPSGHVFVCCE
ncbi:hypothetical protein FH608_048450 [Nonomuraea phyllanthi]|uniref:DUF4097 domain-containing protein n=1 Tax=Nonomuraea phyllanthi TaxID=2219224 RepID=A0A5C4V003_9ACTN|nr:DUF4097 family beta strand repeat-containing protein [Nonomuraea phyllanthi]KAB8184326.1 hypothetical protein FH608_048450 [Nonomuraea phyllanthi]QFY12583.1 hypothetical protein GBF35_43765 [Nonomuraea phyllanthi]